MRHAVRLSRLTVAALLAVVFPLLAASPSTGTTTPAVAGSMEVNGIVLHYRIVGDGEPLVLLHSGTQTGEMFGPFVEGWPRVTA